LCTSISISTAEESSFKEAVLENFRERGRKLPWRYIDDPYPVLVSEFMLQQTQVKRVIPKYGEWLAAFPDALSLSRAPLAEALRHWSGLGYNRRGKWLWEAGKSIFERFEGRIPREEGDLRSLPGVGPYTARAIRAFAFGIPEAFIETNIRRVFIHFFFQDREDGVRDDEILPVVEKTLDRNDVRSWYYALMDYGAALPAVTDNPNRKSAAYVKQSPFKGSKREARGAILKAVMAGGGQIRDISRISGIEAGRLKTAGTELIAEGLVAECPGGYTTIA
jgi:A/G-specific adenine glycosylase